MYFPEVSLQMPNNTSINQNLTIDAPYSYKWINDKNERPLIDNDDIQIIEKKASSNHQAYSIGRYYFVTHSG